MMRLLLLQYIVSLLSCASSIKEDGESKNQLLYQFDSTEYTQIHSFYDKDEKLLGSVYVKYLDKDVFTSMLIEKEVNGRKDTLYFINFNKLISKKGIEAEVFNEGFYGYKVIMKKNDYIVLSYLRNYGKDVSDDITIEWNYKEGLFELMKAP